MFFLTRSARRLQRKGRCGKACLTANIRYFSTEIYQMLNKFIVTVRIVAEVIERQGFSVARNCQERESQAARKCRAEDYCAICADFLEMTSGGGKGRRGRRRAGRRW